MPSGHSIGSTRNTISVLIDCRFSAYTVYRRYGVAIPRDADAQARSAGRSIAQGRAGDLVFFAGAGGRGPITHVAIYAGAGNIIEAPNSASSVRIVPLRTQLAQFAAALRYL